LFLPIDVCSIISLRVHTAALTTEGFAVPRSRVWNRLPIVLASGH